MIFDEELLAIIIAVAKALLILVVVVGAMTLAQARRAAHRVTVQKM